MQILSISWGHSWARWQFSQCKWFNCLLKQNFNCKNYPISETRWQIWLGSRHKILIFFWFLLFPTVAHYCNDIVHCGLQISLFYIHRNNLQWLMVISQVLTVIINQDIHVHEFFQDTVLSDSLLLTY